MPSEPFLRRALRLSALSFALGVATSAAHAQALGELKGHVTDATGAAIPSASVTLTDSATHTALHARTTSAGDYDFSQLNSSRYTVAVEASGFASFTQVGITVTTGTTVRADVMLKAGNTEAVTVNSDLPLLQAATSDMATTIPGHQVQALPLNARNFIQLTQLAPGVALPPGQLLPRINGGRPRTNEYLYDGVSALQPEPGQVVFFPIIDDIAEFSVEANNVPAEFGRFNGGVVNVATRSGTADFHGSVYEFFRNEALNARNFFARTGAKPQYRRNMFGATLGGPIVKDKLFFFADYQGLKQRIGIPRISTVPTEAMRGGNFSGVAKIYNPCTTTTNGAGQTVRTEFTNDTITTAQCAFDAKALTILNLYPHAQSAAASNNYSYTNNDDDHQNQFDVRLDGALGRKDRGFVRYSYFSEADKPADYLPLYGGLISSASAVVGTSNVTGVTNVLGQQVVLNETHTFTSSLLNDFRVGYTRRGNSSLGAQLNGTATSVLGIPNIPVNSSYANTMPQFTFTGYQQLGSAASASGRYQTAVGELIDTLVWTKSSHTIKLGADLRRYELNAFAPPLPTGSFQFTTTGTDTTSTAGAVTGGNAFASFLLGQVDTYTVDLQQRTIRPRDYIHEFFAQDDWRVTPKLTLNLGARWTLHMPSTETHNQGAVFNLATQQLDYLGVNGNSRSARELHWTNVAPRVGFAYSPNALSVIRGGYGIVFIDQSGITTPFTTPQYPFIQNVQQKTTDGYIPAFALAAGPSQVTPIAATPDAGLGQSVYTANRKMGSGYSQQWNLAVQQAFTPNLSLEVAYIGSHIVHLGIPDQNLNQLTDAQIASGLAGGAAATNLTGQVANPYFNVLPRTSVLGASAKIAHAQLLKPYAQFQNIAIYRNNTGSSVYNGLSTKLEQRTREGLTFLVSYTWSKLIDPASSVFSSTVLSSPNTSSLIMADTYRPWLERDLSNGDMTNVASVSAVYELTKFKGHGFLTPVLGGWTINGIYTMQSGMPVTVTNSTNNNAFAGVPLQRPNIVGDPVLPSSQRNFQHWFNTSAFQAAPQFTFGNASRNPVRGPAYRDLDLSLSKHTALGAKTDLEFRAEVFDVTNTPGLGSPNGSVGAAAFGTITATSTDPRVVQFALRLSR
ncbi:carboxypeptidase regulatory-like domain-containing protein [Granulicella cerasi]|uniref:Carboxypeptidase regulatory-like domain-containing protein n=1 Tax=Granulicella cerasi TaxID=741063 RepID=A0ABW1Z7U1_9BACT|nr:carboxypeptidase-like regulatory domain-containing protein [Granulicella cerasi]